ncbi:MAG: DinB family protein [Armatimonadetes bacterium]|nr:DinB family protein [Armatimonadota bacterium]
MVSEAVRTYLLHALEGAPAAIVRVLDAETDWDARPDTDRFTLREMAAHLADWEPIWMERITRIAAEENPFLASVDEGQLCAERNYSGLDPMDSLARYRSERSELIEVIRKMPDAVWHRPAHREFVGDVDFLQQVAMIAGHDGYHLKQALEFTSRASG